jgi:hypothetical protein
VCLSWAFASALAFTFVPCGCSGRAVGNGLRLVSLESDLAVLQVLFMANEINLVSHAFAQV